jgi:hypothetical protein
MSILLSDRKKRNAVEKALRWIRDNSTMTDNGSVRSTASRIPYCAAKEIITQYTVHEGGLPEGTHRRAVNLSVERWLKYKKYQDNKDAVSAFLQALEVEIGQMERKKKLFKVLMFLNLDYQDIQELEPISVLGDKILLKQWGELSALRTNDLWRRIQFWDRSNPILLRIDQKGAVPNLTVFQPVLFDMETYGPEAAVAMASDRLDILRAILNISSLLGGFTYVRSVPKHLSTVLPTPIYGIFDISGGLVSTYYTIEEYRYTKAKIDARQLSNAKYLLPLFAHNIRYPDTYHHILGLMRLYQDAIDISSPRPAYLAMWQVLEAAVTLGQEKVPHREIVPRVSALLQIDPLFQDAVKLLADLRNDLVHSGKFLARGDNAFFTLKLIVDDCLHRLFALARDFPTVHKLRDYVEHITLSDSALERRRKVVSTIQQHRTT